MLSTSHCFGRRRRKILSGDQLLDLSFQDAPSRQNSEAILRGGAGLESIPAPFVRHNGFSDAQLRT
jgi:hypothetical protein